MYNAPSVSYPVGRCALVGWFLGGVALLAVYLQVGTASAGWAGAAWVPWRWALSSGAWVLGLGWAGWTWWHSPEGWLIWAPAMADEPLAADDPVSGWWWSSMTHAGEGQEVTHLRPMLMFNAGGLLYAELAGPLPGVKWLWVQAHSAPERWWPLRRALRRHAC